MNTNNKKLIDSRIANLIVGILFALVAIIWGKTVIGNVHYFISFFGDYGFDFPTFLAALQQLMQLIAPILLAVAHFAKTDVLKPIGFGLFCFVYLISLLRAIFYAYSPSFLACFDRLILIAAYALLLVAVIKKDNLSLRLCVAAAGLFLVDTILGIVGGYSFVSILVALMLVVAFVMTGFAIDESKDEKNAYKNATSVKKHSQNTPSSSDQLEKLASLKKLLDDEVITQEEFDEKKKQLLGV